MIQIQNYTVNFTATCITRWEEGQIFLQVTLYLIANVIISSHGQFFEILCTHVGKNLNRVYRKSTHYTQSYCGGALCLQTEGKLTKEKGKENVVISLTNINLSLLEVIIEKLRQLVTFSFTF